MTWTQEYTFWCDGSNCEEWTRVGDYSLKDAKKDLRNRGWVSPSHDEHYCPDCAEKSPGER